MRHEYFNTKTRAFFSVQSISDFRKDAAYTNPNKWFTILMSTKVNGEMAIDEYILSLKTPCAIFITPGSPSFALMTG